MRRQNGQGDFLKNKKSLWSPLEVGTIGNFQVSQGADLLLLFLGKKTLDSSPRFIIKAQ
jgi:hypothetical protein